MIVAIDAVILEDLWRDAKVEVYSLEVATGVVVVGPDTERLVEALLEGLLGAAEEVREMDRLLDGGGARYLPPGGAAESPGYGADSFGGPFLAG